MTTDSSSASSPPQPLPPPPGSFFLGDSGFSVYEEMGRHLREGLRWRRRPATQAPQCDLILGDRFNIPYPQLRCSPLPGSSFFGGTRWVNYFQGSHRLTQKAAMAELLRGADATCEATWMPRSFVLGGPQSKQADERIAFAAAAESSPLAVWIIKPSSGAKGEEIVIVRGPSEAAAFVRDRLEGRSEGKKRYVAQRYVERPLLLSHGRKFDVRVWALLTCPPYTVYAFTQGSCRTASLPFDLTDIANTHSHLTNHCVQEGNAAFGRYEPGNEMWFAQLERYLVEELHREPAAAMSSPAASVHSCGSGGSCVLETVVLPQMANIIVRSLLAAKGQLETVPGEPFSCFQLFGYDFIIEDDLTVQLLEINGSPGVAVRFLPSVVASMLGLLGCGGTRQSGATATSDTDGGGGSGGGAHDDGGNDPQVCEQPLPPREWSIDCEGFALLWREGDAIPEGLTV